MSTRPSWTVPLLILILAGLTVLGWQAALAAPPVQEVADLSIITSPQSNAIVRGQVPIVGSATHPQFQLYKVEYAAEPVGGDESYAIVGTIHEDMVVDGELAMWDTTPLPDGSYTIRLRVVRLDGNYSEYSVSQVVVANTQPEQPTETPTPEGGEEEAPPTRTPTPLPPTPTIVIEQPGMETEGTAAPSVTRTPLPTPEKETASFDFSLVPLQTACMYGAGAMLALFLLFGFMAALRNLIYALLGRRGK
jgi:hypothetical protein